MRKFLPISLLVLLLACTEKIEIQSKSDYHEYLAVQATLTNQPTQPQQVVLSRSISFFHDEPQPMVKGAYVSVNDIRFTEREDGVYVAPMGFACQENENYHLEISLPDGEVYTADAQMPESGFEIEAIDYAWGGGRSLGADSLWTVGLWGIEKEIESNYLVTHAINGYYVPFDQAFIINDNFFNDKEIAGFPVQNFLQLEQLRKQYGECYKYLETGDVITLEIWTLDNDYETFLYAINSGGLSIPLLTPQPANLPTNIRGKNVMGFFAICPVERASVVVEDPFRPYFKRSMPLPL